jgi:STE24 endopeptidase
MQEPDKASIESRAKKYSTCKYILALIETAYTLVLLFLFAGSGLSRILAVDLRRYSANKFISVPLYVAIVSLGYYLLNLPLNFYRSYTLEHRFSLSTQKIRDWLVDQVKAGIISYIIVLILIGAFYGVLKYNPATWWLIISVFWIFFSLVLAKLTPIVIIPLFFKYKKLSDETLRQRILGLAQKMKVKILDCFEIDFSKKTLKANAAFVGVGNTRRVLLADTLKDKYSHDEIEVILAHEFAHYRLKHLLKLILVNSLATILVFYLIFKTSGYALNIFGLHSLSDLAALPVIFIYFILFGLIMQPFEAFISRAFEKNADMMALRVTGLKSAFISMMEKLAAQNLADRSPHPLIKFFFFDHPPVDERINMAKST